MCFYNGKISICTWISRSYQQNFYCCCAASKSLVWKALISVKNRQTQSGSVRCSWEITLIYISPCFQCILVPAYQNIEFPHWGMAWEMPTPLPLQQSNSFQTFSRVSFSWAALVFKGTAFMPWWTQFLSKERNIINLENQEKMFVSFNAFLFRE